MGYKTEWLKGIFPALVTPFTADDRVDEAAFRELIRFVLPHVDGVVPCGTTGEFSYLTLDERKQVLEICLDEVAGRVPVLAGTGCTSTRETVALTAWAKEAGAKAALIVAPYFLKPTFNEVYDHFKAVDDEVMIALATVHPRALDRHSLYQSVYAAAAQALTQVFAG